jgi:hypothetical protein
MAFPPVPFQEWFLRQTSTGNAALNAYVARVKADGGVVEAIGCVPLAVWDWTDSFAPTNPVPPTLLLDLYPNAAAAYSLRKLRAAYSGSAVRVRKEVSSVSSETDIGFAADGSLDTASLLAFASDADSGDVFVVTWYDQSLSNNATQSTAANQPKIVSGGSLVTENGKPAIDFDGVNDCFILDSKITISTTVLFVDVMSNIGVGFSAPYGSNNSSNGVYFPRSRSLFQGNGFSDNSSVVDLYGSQSVTSISSVSGIYNIYQNGVVRGSSGTYTGNTVSTMMVRRSSDLLGITSGKLQERIIYNNSDQSANRTGIESNQATFYGITL